jgi:hypothetical protein
VGVPKQNGLLIAANNLLAAPIEQKVLLFGRRQSNTSK